ncbi:hypothetical protein [Paenibacillus xylanivorans]|uniref:Uncharacterized protein n=1 Tax=Paenibacillus xylanivorans TaxID=1705561 RepID=A0A0N0C570_9BACL|nr:hypothetical protein [Paenibacillus xylanivorans]KOY16787.1 hypothetical protein AMS66_07855 [Paenibacillus xylanivorans]
MRDVKTIVDFSELLKIDEDLNETKKQILNWLKNYLPYTEKILKELNVNGFTKYPSIIDEYYKYLREFNVVEEEKHELIKIRILTILRLLNEFYENKHDLYIDSYESILNIKAKAFRNMLYMSSKAQSINKLDREQLRKQDIIMFHLTIYKDTIEGVLNKLLSPIIFILECESNNTPIEIIESRYFSEKYFDRRNRNRNFKNIERDFNILFEDTNTSLRNAEAHFDFSIDEKNEMITYKTGNRNSPMVSQSSFDDLKREINVLSEVARQIGIAYEIFWYEHANEFNNIFPETNFDEKYIALRQALLRNRFVLRGFKYSEGSLNLYFNYDEELETTSELIPLLRQSINFLSLGDDYEEEVNTINLIVNEFVTLTIELCVVRELENDLTKESFELFVNSVLANIKTY